jgi:hypothetical protein
MSRLRKRVIIPEDTNIRATLTDPKIVHGNFGRQVELAVNVASASGEHGDQYKGTMFKTWFSFGQDKETKEEYIAYGGPLYQLLGMVAPKLDEVLEDEDLSEREYERFIKKSVKMLDELDVVARVGVRVSKKDENKKNNFLMPGTFGPYRDPDEDFEALPMGDEEPAPL